ncbi:MAG TPA: Rv1535 family protein [Mycobacterium sp.]|nr:Rv1535 family protein [Mycobacterium sp.]HTX94915.1 Rv1535 family protein [Mycobacterium sp.]
MTAVLEDNAVSPPAPVLTLEPAPKPASPRRRREPIGGGDPLVDAATRLLSIPLRQVYAVLWRVGLIEVMA